MIKQKHRRKRKKTDTGRIYRILVVIILIAGSVILAEKIYELWTVHHDMEQTIQQEESLRKEQEELQARQEQLHNPDAVEEEARRQFGLVKPGEIPYKR